MRVFRGYRHSAIAPACALTIGNFDGVHRGHQAMLALLRSQAAQRGLPTCVLTFEPHPRDFFAALAGTPQRAPARIATLRDKLAALERCGVDQTVVLRFDHALASMTPQAFEDEVLRRGLNARHVLVGDDFRYGARRAGDHATLAAAGFDTARMDSHEVQGLRVSSSAVRAALAEGDMAQAALLLGRPYAISGHVVHGRRLGRALGASSAGSDDGFRTLNLRFGHANPAAGGIFAVRTHGIGAAPLDGVASLGVRPTVEEGGRVLLETHCFDWPAQLGAEGGYGRLCCVELLAKLRDEACYDTLDALTAAIDRDASAARAFFAAEAAQAAAAGKSAALHAAVGRQTMRDRI